MDADCKAVYGSGPLYTTDIKASLPIFIPPGATGIAALPPVTLPQMFHATAGKYPGGKAVMWRVPDDVTSHNQPYSFYANLATKAVGSHWEGMTWAQLEQQCYVFANACLAMGFGDKDACVVMGFNTPQWLIAFHGSIMAGGVVSGSYPTNGKDTCEYLAKDCGAKLVLAESWTHGSKFESLLNDSSHKLSKIVVWGDMSPVRPRPFRAARERPVVANCPARIVVPTPRRARAGASGAHLVGQGRLVPRLHGQRRRLEDQGRRDRGGAQAGRVLLAHLHVRHDGPAEGRDALARLPHVGRQRRRRLLHDQLQGLLRPRPGLPVVPPPLPHRRAGGEPLSH